MLTFFCLIFFSEFEVGLPSSIELLGPINYLVKILFLSKYKNMFFAWDITVLVTRPYYRIGFFIA
jgi:hypothetical protein